MSNVQFRDEVKPEDKLLSTEPMRAAWAALSERIFYFAADATKPESFTGLAEFLKKTDAQVGTPGNYLFYLSVRADVLRPHRPAPGQERPGARRRTAAGAGWSSRSPSDTTCRPRWS